MVAIEIFICCLVAYDFVLSDDTFYERLWATKEFLLMTISHQPPTVVHGKRNH